MSLIVTAQNKTIQIKMLLIRVVVTLLLQFGRLAKMKMVARIPIMMK